MTLHHNSNPSSAADSTTRMCKLSERLQTQAQLLTRLLDAVKSPASPALAKTLARLSDAWEQCEDVIEDYYALAQPGDGAPCPYVPVALRCVASRCASRPFHLK